MAKPGAVRAVRRLAAAGLQREAKSLGGGCSIMERRGHLRKCDDPDLRKFDDPDS